MFQKELMLTRQMHQNTVTFVIIVTFLDKNFKYEPCLCTGCHDLIKKALNFNNVAIVSIKGSHYRIHFWYMSKDDAINTIKNCKNDATNITKNSDLNEKSGLS